MNGRSNCHSRGVMFPAKKGTEGEMLDDGEFGKDLSIIHFDHALIPSQQRWIDMLLLKERRYSGDVIPCLFFPSHL